MNTLIKEPFVSTAAPLISCYIEVVRSLEKLSIPLPTPVRLCIVSDVRRCSSVPYQWRLLVLQQVGDRLVKAGVQFRKVRGICEFMSSAYPADSCARNRIILFYFIFLLRNGMRFVINLGILG